MIAKMIWTIALLAIVHFIYRIYLTPKKLIKYYEKQFIDKGYRVKILPIIPFVGGYLQRIKQDTKKCDCFLSFKQDYCHYDVVISNTKSHIRIILINPKLIKEFIMAEKDFLLTKTPYANKSFAVLTQGILFNEKEAWKRKRRIVSNVFSYDFVAGLSIRIAEIFEQALISCENHSKESEGKYQIHPLDYTGTASSSVIMECFLGCDSQNMTIKGQKMCHFLIKMLDDFVERLIDPISFLLGDRFIRSGIRQRDRNLNARLQQYDAWSKQYISKKAEAFNKKIKEQGVENTKTSDLIEAILLENQRVKDKNDIYSQQQILDEFKLFLLAGTDTTSHFLQMMIYYVTQYPKVQEVLREECAQFNRNEEFTMENLKKLKYVDAVMKETGRMYGPANFVLLRQAQADFNLGGIKILKGTNVSHMSMGTHYSPQYYQKPLQFRPQRWLNGQCNELDPYAHLSFSAGSRSCIGRQLALLEAKIGLVKFLKRYSKMQAMEKALQFSFKFTYTCQNFNLRVAK